MKTYSIDFRQKILDTYHTEPISQKAIAKRFSVALSFVQKLLKQYRETKNITPRTDRCGVKGKLNAEQLLILGKLIEENNDATLEELRYLLYGKIGFSVSISTIARMIKLLDITVKKKTLFPSGKGTERVQILRCEFWEKIKKISLKDLIFIDESGVNLAMVRLYARALKGQRAKGPKPTKRGQNVSIIGAMSVSEILTSVNLIGGTDAITFEAFIIRKLVPKLWKGACVVMDNCPIHLGDEVKKAIEKKGAKLILLSPYSPDFSPIENLWSKLKNILRSIETPNYQELAKAIELALGQVTSSNIFNWFTHCCYCTSSF
ncbi:MULTISPECIES: IS630 family transposase [unclassified Microcoleus]|jgi:transposase|uniref:IS630 family transposase n=2 Tax=unclassified Microcoleus TaxID=2642155 RepID=UPI001DFEE03D|nr:MULTISPECIES: IS630 family transposase [unclassified Microcoleus]MCC3466057.1 IS630 family transposase [Microcoleus sp. PH2017_06_SFM_O_A]TAE11753.1 MAG: IS630 family transposase [Oscillatoriales cyanobacterium]MCC3414823.1 IS630 family transposase [Microcoleus sp. PH2017_02_FOX_O_A]MCC3516816.1 IS630 family transposase [Microcoleus sp. PH2017_18_LLB_O_A]MCC3536400.1 IS630 family transposase [Microcoleus sp. PH2017_25_DOB_D_A]